MAGWNHSDANWKDKTCVVCQETFTPKSGVQKLCSTRCRGKWKYISGKVTTESQYKNISGNWERYLTRLQYVGGRRRDKLSVEILLEILEKQNYRCALSGLELTCELEVGKNFPRNVSIDRIKAGGSYEKDNIQLVCKALNCWRSDTSIEEFVTFCRAVSNHFDQLEIGD